MIKKIRDPLIDYWGYDPDDDKNGGFYTYKETVRAVADFIDVYGIGHMFDVPPKGHPHLTAEAWVPLLLKPPTKYWHYEPMLTPFVGETVILTYPNSD